MLKIKIGYILFLVVILLSIRGNSAISLDSEHNKLLTVEQTIGLAFVDPSRLPPNFKSIYLRSNPAAIDQIRSIISNSNSKLNSRSTAYILGHIGDDRDIDYIFKHLKARWNPGGIWVPLGFLARKGSRRAKDLIDQALTVEFWDSQNIYEYDKEILTKKPAYKLVSFSNVLIGYYISGKNKFPDTVNRKVNSITDIPIRKQISGILRDKVLKDTAKFYLTGKYSDDNPVLRKPLSNEEMLFIVSSSYNNQYKRLKKSANSRNLLAKPKKLSTSLKVNLFKTTFVDIDQRPGTFIIEAQKEFHDIFNSSKLEFNVLSGKILDNGKPLSSKGAKFATIKEELVKDFEVEKKIFAGLKQIEFNEYLNPAIDIKLEIIAPQMRPFAVNEIKSIDAQLKADKKSRDISKNSKVKEDLIPQDTEVNVRQIVTVIFELPNTAQIGQKYKIRGITIAESGNLMVYMMKINGKWYWQPFGW